MKMFIEEGRKKKRKGKRREKHLEAYYLLAIHFELNTEIFLKSYQSYSSLSLQFLYFSLQDVN